MAREDHCCMDDGESGWQGRIIVARMMVRVDGKGGSLLHG